MIHKLQISSLFGAARQDDAFLRFLRIVENAETEIEVEAALKYWRLLTNELFAEVKARALARINAAEPH